MLDGVFVTGTDTNVGKTVAAAALFHRYRALAPLRYWKPIQTGIESDDDTSDVQKLLGTWSEDDVLPLGVRLPRPLSPHLAATLEGESIDLHGLVQLIVSQPGRRWWIVEGAGGVLVPVNDTALMVDLMVLLNLPVVVVARTTLGTINHTLLTLEALRARALRVAGIVMVGDRNADNREAIERYGEVRVLGELPFLNPLSPVRLANWAVAELDPAGSLMELPR